MLRLLCRSLGGLLFVTALVYAIYIYGVVWAAPAATAEGGLVSALLANAAMFAVFALHHSLLARTRVKQRLLSRIGEDDQRTIYVWVASGLLVAVLASWRAIGHLIYAAPGGLAYVCGGGQLLGLVLIVRAGGVIDPLELAGVRGSRGSLEVRGPYRWVRHPIYLGFLLAVWLPASMTGDRLWFAMLTTTYLVAAIPLEERTMLRRLGADYQDYRARVRWRLLPGLY